MTIATWILAIATAVLAAEGGTALLQWRARWEARAEESRTDQARRENDLHRRRFTELWEWLQSQPEAEKAAAARWFGEYTGASAPLQGGTGSPPQTPGLHSADASDAYERYIEFLNGRYDRGL